ncbi:hypothetical protein ACP4OV_021732 [Aristida adscensionis]
MEELWKHDYISLQPPSPGTPAAMASSYHLHHHHHHQPSPSPPPTSSYPGVGAGACILQDFLASGPVLPSSLSAPPQPRTPPPTALRLGSSPEFTYLGLGGGSSSASGDDSRDLLPPSDMMLFGGAFAPRPARIPGGGGDWRQRRMIKNRESAARSRLRKQAYTVELEQKLEELQRENQMLIKRHQELNVRLATTTAQAPDRRGNGQRCRSAPPSLDVNKMSGH